MNIQHKKSPPSVYDLIFNNRKVNPITKLDPLGEKIVSCKIEEFVNTLARNILSKITFNEYVYERDHGSEDWYSVWVRAPRFIDWMIFDLFVNKNHNYVRITVQERYIKSMPDILGDILGTISNGSMSANNLDNRYLKESGYIKLLNTYDCLDNIDRDEYTKYSVLFPLAYDNMDGYKIKEEYAFRLQHEPGTSSFDAMQFHSKYDYFKTYGTYSHYFLQVMDYIINYIQRDNLEISRDLSMN